MDLSDRAQDVNDDLNKEIESRFRGQQNNRPEFEGLEFIDVVRSWTEGGNFMPERIMSKPMIKRFVTDLETKIGVSLFLRSSNDNDEISSTLLVKYIEFIQTLDDLFPSFRQLMVQLQILP